MTFTHDIATPSGLPLMIGLAGYSASGKTKSALRLAAGIQQARGGDVWLLDTECRAQEYGGQFRFQRVPFTPPFSPQRYQEAVKYAFDHGARIIVIDSMSDEHDGEGGLLDQHEDFVASKAGNDWKARERWNQAGWARVKPGRKRWENYVRRLKDSEGVVFLPCWRAMLKYVPKTKDARLREQSGELPRDPTEHSWEVSSTSDLPYACSVRFLLKPGENGTPLVTPTTDSERKLVKTTDMFADYLRTVGQLDETVGRRLYELATGNSAPAKPKAPPEVRFHKDFAGASGPVDQSDPPTLDAYLAWCETLPASPKRDRHMADVRSVFGAMVQAEAS